MFEGFVSQVLLGYLGRYIKGIQKDQLKIGLWREEVLLENVELILEAFDYLQLPFALKTGKVGKLSIKVPWKKLGWEPIIVALEDVFICACQREDNEWSSDSVEKRELAGKMAKLNAIELAKFSRRVSDNPAGQSFLSYIYAKILDNIQVSIKNVHIIYIDSHNDKGNFIFGLKFFNLTIMTDSQKQNTALSTVGKSRTSQVNKCVEISNIGLYCNLREGNPDPLGIDGTTGSQLCCDVNFEPERDDYLVNPFDVSISLLVNKTGKLDGAPQYAIIAELTTLVVSLNDILLEQILSLLDYFSVSALREKYGRYRPPQYSLSQKLRGWQRMWWQYAQESVLAHVRQKLRKMSWSNLGKRISQCRRYVNLYKRKLELLQKEQHVNKDILMELEKMDKECEIDDILNFRGIAEYELQELVNSNTSYVATDDLHSQEKQQSSDQSTNRERGWLNWLSLGMLGAGGTADSSSFAGVVSDEIIKDIYDATEFHPVPSSGGDSSNRDKFCSFSVKLKILQIVSTFSTGRLKRNIAKAIFDGIDVESKVWEGSVAILSLISSIKIINPCDNVAILLARKVVVEESLLENTPPFINIQVMLQPNQSSELSVKVMFQPFEVTHESEFYLDLLHFCHVLTSFEFQHCRVLRSLNGVTSFKTRLLSKTEYISFNRKKINWDVIVDNVVIKLPLNSEVPDNPIMTLELGGLSFTSRPLTENDRQELDNCCFDSMYEEYLKNPIDNVPLNLQLRDLYDYYTIKLTGFEVYMSMCTKPGATSVIEKFNASVGIRLCIFFDEPMLKALEVDCILPSVRMQFSPAILYGLVGACDKLLQQNSEDVAGGVLDATEIIEPDNFQFSVSVKSEQLSLSIGLEEDELKSSVIFFTLTYIDFRYTMQEYPECYFFVKFLKAKELNGESSSCVLCSSRNDSGNFSPRVHVEQVGLYSQGVTQTEDSSEEGCFKFKYHSQRDGSIVQHECKLFLNDLDLHIYPRIFGLLKGLSDKLNKQSVSSANSLQLNQHREATETVGVGFSKFCFPNFYDTEPSTTASTRVQFPFVTIYNSGSLSSLEGSLVCDFPELQSSILNYRHPEIPTFKFRRKPRTVDYATAQSPFGTEIVNTPKHSNMISMFLLDVNLNGLRAYFHDSSCILGTITLPKSRSFFLSQGNDCWDAQISTEGLMLSSSWSPPNIRDQLWGPASPSTSPILNIRIRKQKTDTLFSMTEISFGIQHVSCVMPSSYLAMMIGYFSLPDWSTKGSADVNNQASCENKEFGNVPSRHSDFLYKIEILHSRLILPVESQTDFYLQLGLSQLYFSFLPKSSGIDANADIPSCCVIPTNPFADKLDIVNIFGRSMSLSLISLKNDADILLKPDQYSPIANVPLIEQLDADMWIRIPCTSNTCAEQSAVPTLIMMKEYVCNFIAQDRYTILGFQAIARIIDELSSVGEESKLFSCDVLQFLQVRKSLKEANSVTPNSSNSSYISMKICAKAVSIKFSRLWMEQPTSSETVAKLDFQLNFSASLKRGILKSLDVDIPVLVLHSVPSNLPLASFVSDTMASHLCINFSQPEGGGKELLFAIPLLDVWLHLSELNNFIDVLWSCSKSNSTSASSGHESICDDVPESQFAHNSTSECMTKDVILIVKSENSAIAVHVPIFEEEDLANSETDGAPMYWKYVKFVLHNRYAEFTVAKSYMILKCNMEKMRAILETIHGQNISSIPFIQISQIKLESKVEKERGELMHVVVDVQIEALDVGISYQIFSFWSRSHFKFSERSSIPLPCHCIVYHVRLRKGSVLISDGRWSYHGPIFEILTKSMLAEFKQTQDALEGTTNADIIINYNNIDKVMWEPFVEPCSIRLNLVRKVAGTVLLNPSATTDIYLESTEHLNLNITEPLVEAIFRIKIMVNDALKQCEAGGLQENHKIMELHSTDDVHTRRYAPYILQNDTSLPLTFHVSRGSISTDDICGFLKNHGNIVQPGHTVPIYVEETVDEQHFRHRTAYSSERLIEKKINVVAHHMISIHLEGTTSPSKPMSMDLVGLSYFEVNFSNNKLPDTIEIEREDDFSGFNRMTEKYRSDQNKGLVVPVVFEVSMQHYSKRIRLYSTVILFNATSMPLELRFDIPFGVSPKVLDPILPGQEIPLPLHLAEAGRIRWRPLGNNYLWSEAHLLSNILSQEYRLGFLRSFVCYPAHPTSDPFRCCISIQDYSLSGSGGTRKVPSLGSHVMRRDSVNGISQSICDPGLQKKHLIRQVRFTTPFSVKNYLPIGLSLMIESGGVPHSIYVQEVDVASVFLVDSTNDLGITFKMEGYKPVVAKFPRAESFSSMAKINGSKCYLFETLSLYPETSSGPIYVTLEKAMDASSGAREICVYVSFLLYNCTGLVLAIVDGEHERRGSAQIIPSSYNLIGDEHLLYGKQGLRFLSPEIESFAGASDVNNHAISIREKTSFHLHKLSTRHFSFPFTYRHFADYINNNHPDARGDSISSFENGWFTNVQLHRSANNENVNDNMQIGSIGSEEVKPYMYCPLEHTSASELRVKLSAHMPQSISGNALYSTWSSLFPLVPSSGSANVVIPKPSGSGAFLISATSIPVAEELSGRTRAITFQPRYVICNACNRDLRYKQKGTNDFYQLGIGQHSHLHWSDTSRELYVSIQFNETGWEWSGSFLPDCLGDVQVKMRNYVSGTLHMVRVEVQNAEFAISDKRMIKNANANSSTQLILLSDDNSGFMPYRIDNFSMERLRIYQQRCEFFETIVHAYTSAYYAWDEPCYPHRLVVEVPGERILGTYTLDSIQEYLPVHLPSTAEKAERRLHISVHAEGAIKVLSIIDSSYHITKDVKETGLLGFNEKKKNDRKQGAHADFSEVLSVHLPFIGISLINSSPQELVFVCARGTVINIMQSLDEQKFSFQTLALQIDNQLSDTPYPIILSFDNEHKGKSTAFLKNKEHALRMQNKNPSPTTSESTNESVIYFAAAKWRNADASLISFKYINLRLAPLCIELEEQVLLSLFDFFRTVSSRLQSRDLQKNFEMRTVAFGKGAVGKETANNQYHMHRHYNLSRVPKISDTNTNKQLLPSVIPIGTPWQQIKLSGGRQKKIYIEVFEMAPMKLSLSFTSTPWMIRNETHPGVENLAHIGSTTFQRSLIALVDVEGVPVHLRELTFGHLMANRESIEEIVIKHYTRQLLHEMYKVFGSAGVIGNPIGFARNVGLGIRDFLSVSSREIVQSPIGLLSGVAQGSKSLFSNTVYAISSATSQFTKTAHKGIVAFTFDEQAVTEMDAQLKGLEPHGKGVLSEFLEGLTGLLQSPIRGAEKHGLPGVLSGIAMGTAGLVARPMASILEAIGKTAQSIRKRSNPHQSNCLRIRFPRPLARELPLLPYSWEEAIGVAMLLQADGSRFRDETFVMCKALKQSGKFVIISERLVFSVWCPCLVDLGSPEFVGVDADPEWVIETDMSLESIVHIDRAVDAVNIVGSNAETASRQKKGSSKDNMSWKTPTSAPLFYMRVEFRSPEEAEDVLQVLLSTIDQGKERRWGSHVLHRSNLR